MVLSQVLIGGLIAALAVLFLIFKFGDIRKVLAFDIWIDLGSTIILSLLMAGTFSGIMIAITAGAIISVTLFALKLIVGQAKFTFRGFKPTEETAIMKWAKERTHARPS